MIPVNTGWIIAVTILVLLSYEFFNAILRTLLRMGYITVERAAKKLIKDKKTSAEQKALIRKELTILELIRIKKIKLGYINRIVGYIEAGLFFVIGCSLIRSSSLIRRESLLSLLAIIAGWMAIKIFGNYKQWSGPIFGRATYYLFLIGSFANIALGFGFGLLVGNLFK